MDRWSRDQGRARLRRSWAGAAAAAFVLHAAALGGLDGGWPRAEAHGLAHAPPLEVRIVVAPVAPVAPVASVAPIASMAPLVEARARATVSASAEPTSLEPTPTRSEPRAARRPARARPVAVAVAELREARRPPEVDAVRPVVFEPEPQQVAMAAVDELSAAAPPDPARAALTARDGEPVPHYRTLVPPSVVLRYEVRRGALSGVGEIAWHKEASHYDLKLEFRYAGLSLLQQTSSGGFDAEGLAPLRFVDQRIRRAATAANFRRDAGRLSYSGSADESALQPGTQDRLSWMVQLAAIVAADPALARPGGRVMMAVTGARGDLAVWTFRSLGPEALELRSGPLPTVKFVREARHEHDITVQAWLDPARHYLPAGAFQQSGSGDEPYELRLVEAH